MTETLTTFSGLHYYKHYHKKRVVVVVVVFFVFIITIIIMIIIIIKIAFLSLSLSLSSSTLQFSTSVMSFIIIITKRHLLKAAWYLQVNSAFTTSKNVYFSCLIFSNCKTQQVCLFYHYLYFCLFICMPVQLNRQSIRFEIQRSLVHNYFIFILKRVLILFLNYLLNYPFLNLLTLIL